MEKIYLLPRDRFQAFFDRLRAFGVVHAPVKVSDSSYSFQAVSSPAQIAFKALRTILPPKKFFYPQQETLIEFTDGDMRVVLPEVEPFVLFGIHPCDLAGLRIVDETFTAAPADSHYIARRKKALIVGLSCMPDKHCFCQSMGTDEVAGGYDIFLTELEDAFYVQLATPQAAEQFDGADCFVAVSADDRQAYKGFWRDRKDAFTSGFDRTNLIPLLDAEWEHPVWEELGERCLSCGNCTPVCPTCYCFDIIDIAQLSGDAGERRREWDSCQLVGFAKVAGDYNFRPGPVDRLKFWHRHKLHGFDDPHRLPTCVGCGRCTVSCPAAIDDIVGTVLRLQDGHHNVEEDYRDAGK